MRNLNVLIILCLDYLKPRIRQYVDVCQLTRVLLRIELSIVAKLTDNSTCQLELSAVHRAFWFCIEISLRNSFIEHILKQIVRSCFLYDQVQTIMGLIVELL